jgi:hypothetical protein
MASVRFSGVYCYCLILELNMSDLNLQPETETPAKKKCCGKIKGFFTKEAKEGQRVLNWKFGVLIAVVVLIVWII